MPDLALAAASLDSQIGFTLESLRSAQVPLILGRVFYSSGRVAPGKTQVGAELGLHHLGNSRASVPSGQL